MEFKLLIAGIGVFVLARILRRYKGRIAHPLGAKIYNEAYEWIETGWSAILLAAFIMYFFLQAFKIPSGSMRMTLLEGDHLFVNKFVYGFHIPLSHGKRFFAMRAVKRGDIVVFRCPPSALSESERREKIEKDFIKRCVAISGDTVELRDKTLYVNGVAITEPYVQYETDMVFPTYQLFKSSAQYQSTWEKGEFANISGELIRDNFGPVTVPKNHYFVMGDNRDKSFDGRFWGPLDDSFMKGRALLLYWPLKRVRIIQ